MRLFRILLMLLCTLPPSVMAASLVTNGGFENPSVNPAGNWGLFSSLPGWAMSGNSNSNVFEIQNNTTGTAFEGSQYLELDSNATTSFYQDLNTVANNSYLLTFAFSPRVGVVDNVLNVWWDGVLLQSLKASGVSNSNTNWVVYNYLVTTSKSVTRLAFDNLTELSNSYGSLLDGVSVTTAPVSEPTSVFLLIIGGLLIFINQRRQIIVK